MPSKTITHTEDELLEMIDQKNEEIQDLHKQIEKLEKYKKYEESADETFAMYESFVHAGFNDKQAFTLVTTVISAAMRPKLF